MYYAAIDNQSRLLDLASVLLKLCCAFKITEGFG